MPGEEVQGHRRAVVRACRCDVQRIQTQHLCIAAISAVRQSNATAIHSWRIRSLILSINPSHLTQANPSVRRSLWLLFLELSLSVFRRRQVRRNLTERRARVIRYPSAFPANLLRSHPNMPVTPSSEAWTDGLIYAGFYSVLRGAHPIIFHLFFHRSFCRPSKSFYDCTRVNLTICHELQCEA